MSTRPKNRTGRRLVVTLPVPLYDRLKARAERDGDTMASIVNYLVRKYLDTATESPR